MQKLKNNFERALKLTKIDKEHASERHWANVETMRILAEAKIRQYKRDEAIQILDTILENDRSDVDSYLKAAHLTEQFDYDKAVNYYLKAIEFMEKKSTELRADKQESNYLVEDFVNPIYYNNIAVLYMKKEMKEEAKTMILKAKESLKAVRKISPQSLTYKWISITLMFNEAWHFESLGEIAEATNIYKLILKDEPYYVDAYLRLAILADKRGSLAKAIEYGEKAAKYQLDRKQVVPYWVLGNFYLKRNQVLKAEKEFSNVINKNPHDSYAYLSLGNIMYNEAWRLRENPKEQEDKLREAMKRYLKAMEWDDSNAFAAICVANVIGEYGMIDEAMEIYRVIRENNSNFSHAMINSGHVLASEGQVANALKLFEKVLERFYQGKNETLELWIARLHYQSKNYNTCQKVLTRLIHRNPSNIIPKFDLALCLQSKSIEVLNLDYREVKQTLKTISDLNVAKSIFSSLIQSYSSLPQTLPSSSSSQLPEMKEVHARLLKIADDRLFFIKDTLQSSDRYLEHDIEIQNRLKAQEEENRRKIKEAEEQELIRKAEEQRLKEERQRERDLQAEESAKVIEQMAAQWAEEERKKREETEEVKKSKRKKEGKRKKNEEDEFVVDDESDEVERLVLDKGLNDFDEKSLEQAELLGMGGLEALGKEHKRKKEKKSKKEKKEKKDKKDKKGKKERKHKKNRLKRMHREGEGNDGENWGDQEGVEEKKDDGINEENQMDEDAGEQFEYDPFKRQKYDDE